MQVGFRQKDVWYVPCSGLTGVNLVENKEPKLEQWYSGPPLIKHIGMGEESHVHDEAGDGRVLDTLNHIEAKGKR